MQSVYTRHTSDDNFEEWDRLEYEQPLRKFNLDGADRFTESACTKACELANEGMADAFRLAGSG